MECDRFKFLSTAFGAKSTVRTGDRSKKKTSQPPHRVGSARTKQQRGPHDTAHLPGEGLLPTIRERLGICSESS